MSVTGKLISELDRHTPLESDLIPVCDPATGLSGAATVKELVASGLPVDSTLPSGGLSGQALTIGLDGTPGWNYAVSDLTELLAAIPANMPFQNDFMAGIRILPQYNDAGGHPVLATTAATALIFPRAIVAQIFLAHNHSVTEIHLPSVVECQLTLNDCTELTKLELGNCERFRQAVFLNLPKLKSITLTAAQTNGISFQNCAELTDINLAQILSIHGDISAHHNPKLTSFELKEVHFTSVNLNNLTGNVFLHDNALGATSVNNILMALVSLNGHNGTSFWGPGKKIDLTGGTNAAPTGAGIEFAKTLIARGATVMVNGPAITTNRHISQIPDYDTVTNRGMVPTVKTDGTGVEWKVGGSSTATNIAGGKHGSIVFQNYANSTAFLEPPTKDGQTIYCYGIASGSIPAFGWVDCAIVPPATVANKGKMLSVKADGTGTEWVAGLPTNPSQGQALVWNGNLGNLKWTAQWSVPYADSIWEDGAVPMGSMYGKPGGNNGWFLPGQLGQVLRMGYDATDTNRTNLKPVWDTASGFSDRRFNLATRPATSTELHDDSIISASIFTTDPDTYEEFPITWTAIKLNGMTDGGVIAIAQTQSLLTFSATSLTVCDDFAFTSIPNLTQIDAPSLLFAKTLTLQSCPGIQRFTWMPHEVANVFAIMSNANLNYVNMGPLKRVGGGITINGNPKLKNIQLGNIEKLSGQGIDLQDNGLMNVDAILNTIAGWDGKDGRQFWGGPGHYVNLSGGTNAIPTSGEPFRGVESAQTLIARGCTVTVNGTAITTTKKSIPLVPEFDTVADTAKTLTVKTDGTGLEWKTPTGGGGGGLPAGGTAGQIVTIRADSGAIEWRTASDIEFNIGTALDAITDGRGFSTPFFIAGHIRSTSTSANPGNVQLSGLIVAKEIYIASWESTPFTLKFPSLTLVRKSVNIQRTYATSIEMPVLNYVENVNISNNSLLSNLIINFSSYGPSAFLQISSNPNLTTLDLSRMWLCNVDIGILVTNNSKLTTLKLAPFIFRGGKSLSLNGNALTQACVDEILEVVAHMDGLSGTTNFGTGYSLALNAGTNAAPSAAGVVNKDKIVARGATVTTN